MPSTFHHTIYDLNFLSKPPHNSGYCCENPPGNESVNENIYHDTADIKEENGITSCFCSELIIFIG